MSIHKVIKGKGTIKDKIDNLDRVTEVAFTDFAKNGAVEALYIMQTEEGRYILLTKLTWKTPLSVIETARGEIKEWASDTRLAKHLKEKLPAIKNLELIVNENYLKNSFNGLLKAVKLNSEFKK